MRHPTLPFIIGLTTVLACADGLSPEAILGTWDLVSFNDDPVPGVVVRVNGDECEYEYDTIVLISINEFRIDGSSGRFEDHWKWRCETDDEWRVREMDGTYDLNTETGTLILTSQTFGTWKFSIDSDEMVLTHAGRETEMGVEWVEIQDVMMFRRR